MGARQRSQGGSGASVGRICTCTCVHVHVGWSVYGRGQGVWGRGSGGEDVRGASGAGSWTCAGGDIDGGLLAVLLREAPPTRAQEHQPVAQAASRAARSVAASGAREPSPATVLPPQRRAGGRRAYQPKHSLASNRPPRHSESAEKLPENIIPSASPLTEALFLYSSDTSSRDEAWVAWGQRQGGPQEDRRRDGESCCAPGWAHTGHARVE